MSHYHFPAVFCRFEFSFILKQDACSSYLFFKFKSLKRLEDSMGKNNTSVSDMEEELYVSNSNWGNDVL